MGAWQMGQKGRGETHSSLLVALVVALVVALITALIITHVITLMIAIATLTPAVALRGALCAPF